MTSTQANLLPTAQEVAPPEQAATHVAPSHPFPFVHVNAGPQPPHASGLVDSFRHCPLQSVSPGRHAQAPFRQYWEAPHWVPQAPQCCGSFFRSRHVPLQVVRPGSQAQAPVAHVSNVGLQVAPQAPQFLGSVTRFAQMPPGQVVVPGPAQAHAPEMQVPAAPQLIPHPPQLRGSLARFAHPFVHATSLAGQEHCPETHEAPGTHALPQRPQFCGSLARFAQLPPAHFT